MANLISNIFVTGFGKIFNLIINLLTTLIIARLLSPSDFGIVAMCTIFLGISTTLVESGLGGSLIYYKDTDELDNHTIFWFNLLVSIFLYLLIFLFADYIATFYKTPILVPILRVIGCSIIIHSVCIVPIALLTKELKFKEQAKITIYSSLLSSIIIVIYAYIKPNVWVLVWQNILFNIISAILYNKYCKYFPKLRFSIKKFKRHWKFGSRLLGSSLLKLVYDNMYVQVIGRVATLKDAGFYNQAKKFNDVPFNLLQYPVDRVIFPALSKEGNITAKSMQIISFSSFTIIPVLLLGSIIAPFIIVLLIGERWADSGWMLSFMLFGTIGATMENLNRSFIKAAGRPDLVLKTDLVKRTICLTTLIISLSWGIKGILCAFVINGYIGWIMNCIAYKSISKVSVFLQAKHVLLGIMLSILISGLTYPFIYVTSSYILKIILGIIVYITIYLFIIKIYKKNVYEFYVSLFQKINRRHERN